MHGDAGTWEWTDTAWAVLAPLLPSTPARRRRPHTAGQGGPRQGTPAPVAQAGLRPDGVQTAQPGGAVPQPAQAAPGAGHALREARPELSRAGGHRFAAALATAVIHQTDSNFAVTVCSYSPAVTFGIDGTVRVPAAVRRLNTGSSHRMVTVILNRQQVGDIQRLVARPGGPATEDRPQFG